MVTFRSENSSVATIDSSGVGTAVAEGTTNLHASWEIQYLTLDGGDACVPRHDTTDCSASCEVSAFVPHHLKILSDTVDYPNCQDTIRRNLRYQVVDVNSNPYPGQCLGCLKTKEKFTNMVNNTCAGGNPSPSGCSDTTGGDGRFPDTLTVGVCSGVATCGFSMTQEYQWCPPGGSPVTLGKSQTTVRRNEVIVAGNSTNVPTNLAGKFLYPDGTVKDN